MNSRLADALQSCLNALERGHELEASLAAYPALAADLRPVLETALAARRYGASEIPGTPAERGRLAFLSHARALGYRQEAAPASRKLSLRLAYALIAAVAVLVLGTGGLIGASADALPGDWLYPVKRASENARLGFTGPQGRGVLQAGYTQRRVEEILALLQLGRVEYVSFEGVLTARAPDVWTVGGLEVLVTGDTVLVGDIRLGTTVEVEGITQADGTLRAIAVRLREFELSGVVQQIERTRWTIGGRAVEVPRSARVEDGIRVGDLVIARLRTDDEGRLRALSVRLAAQTLPSTTPTAPPEATETGEDSDETEFVGFVESISGSSWLVAGRRLVVDARTEFDGSPRVGDRVEVTATVLAGGSLYAVSIEVVERGSSETPGTPSTPVPEGTAAPDEEDEEDGERIEFTGRVESISPGRWVIAGQAVLVDAETEIEGSPGLGDEVRVEAVTRPDGQLHARKIKRDD